MEAFDKSFEIFKEAGADPWTDIKKSKQTILQESTHSATRDDRELEEYARERPRSPPVSFASDPAWPSGSNKRGKLRVTVREQLSALYTDGSDPSVRIDGSILVKASDTGDEPIYLTVRDDMEHIDTMEVRTSLCHTVSPASDSYDTQDTDRILKVHSLPSENDGDVVVAYYTCAPRLRPVPLVSCVGFNLRMPECHNVAHSCL
jgi:hypothetical protein